MSIKKIRDLNLCNKRIFIRVDMNVPLKENKILSMQRIISSLSTIKEVMHQKNTKIILATHLGRPIEGIYDVNYSVFPIVKQLEILLSIPIPLISNYINNPDIILSDNNHQVVMLENVRFNKGEISNDEKLAKIYASFCDIFIMDAFATAHRKHASTYGIVKYVKESCMGNLLEVEITSLNQVMVNPMRPMISIVGGSKVSTKFKVLKNLAKLSDTLIVGGGISNTFIAIDYPVGKSLYEHSFLVKAKELRNNYNVFVPIDSRVGLDHTSETVSLVKNVDQILENEEIMDFGDQTVIAIANLLLRAKTILWNGPVGVYEFPNFRIGTKIIADAIVNSHAFSVVGGGDTIAALDLMSFTDKISYVSTGGGAFLEYIGGNKLPAISILEK